MTEQTFTNFLNVYKALTSPYSELRMVFLDELTGPYLWYESTYFETRGAVLEVLKKIEDIDIRNALQLGFINENGLPEKYVNAKAVRYKDLYFGLHHEVKLLLYYALLQDCKQDVEKIISILENEDFLYRFQPFVRNTADGIELSNPFSSGIMVTIKESMESPHKTLGMLWAGLLLEGNDYRIIFRKTRVEKLLGLLENKYQPGFFLKI